MKKEYINPEMEIVKMQTMSVLAASEVVDKEGTTDSYDAQNWFGFDDESEEEW